MADVTPIRYTLRFPDLASHYLEVEAFVPAEGRTEIDLFLAVWTPGSYLMREYSRHIESVRSEARVEKVAKNRWRFTELQGASCHVTYRVYCREMSVRTNWVEDEFALLNGAPTFLTLEEEDEAVARPHVVRMELPPHWTQVVTALPGSEADGWVADSYETLVDSPWLCGSPVVREFVVNGKPHVLATVADYGLFDQNRAVADLEKVIAAQQELWRVTPYERYVILNVLSESGGGLEHKNSTVLMGSRNATRSKAGYLGDAASDPPRHGWLGLASHEFFHLWNGKRLRPVALGPFAFEQENYTRGLWFVEGVTSYYDDLILARTGLLAEAEYLAWLSRHIEKLQGAPGREVRSVETSSFDAWIREYRPDENTVNATTSYYTKGAVVAFLLDVEIRRATEEARTLDDVLRLAYARYAGERGYTDAEIRDVIVEVGGEAVRPWLERALASTEELDYEAALEWLGLRFAPGPEKGAPWMGCKTRAEGGRLVISQVLRGSPAAVAGLNVEDELIGINGFRVRPEEWGKRWEEYRAGDLLELLTARRDRLREVNVTTTAAPGASWKLEVVPAPTAEQTAHFKKWLAV